MSNLPLISIVIPCYNAESTLEKCLNSVLNQEYRDLEIIIIDDGSTDGTSQIIESFKQKDSRIISCYQNNSGVSKARNLGISKAKGNYICFVDSDDWVETNYCSTLLSLLKSENADISMVEALYENSKGENVFNKREFGEFSFTKERALELLLEDKELQSHPWAKLYKRELFQNISFPEKLQAFEDYYTIFKVFNNASKIVRSNDKLYHYIQFDNSLSHNLTPERGYHFFLAIMETYQFLNTSTSLGNEGKIIKNMIKKLLMVLKRILRNTSKEEMASEKEEIRKSFQSFFKYPINEIGIEYYFFLRLYFYLPNLYSKIIAKK
jgi:glycosyltransferase involved in cell wall biosynthesis